MIVSQMDNYYVCKIDKGKKKGTGFFVKIPLLNENEFLPMLVTCGHMLKKEEFAKRSKNKNVIFK
jgi:hypothetical protein